MELYHRRSAEKPNLSHHMLNGVEPLNSYLPRAYVSADVMSTTHSQPFLSFMPRLSLRSLVELTFELAGADHLITRYVIAVVGCCTFNAYLKCILLSGAASLTLLATV